MFEILKITTDESLILEWVIDGPECNDLKPQVDGTSADDVIFADIGETSYTFTIEYSDVGGIENT